MPNYNTSTIPANGVRYYLLPYSSNNKQSTFENRSRFRLIQDNQNQNTYSRLSPMDTSTIKPMTLSKSNSVESHNFRWLGSQKAGSPTPITVQTTLHPQILSLLEKVINGQRVVIDQVAQLPNPSYNEITLRQQLKEKLIGYSHQELMKANPVFSNLDVQGIVDQLYKKGLQFLHEQENNSQAYLNKFPYHNSCSQYHHQNLQKNHFSRQDSLGSLSNASTAASFYKNSFQHRISYSQLDVQATLALEKFKEIHSGSNKKYSDFYQSCFFNPKETILHATHNYNRSEDFSSTRRKILNSSYNNFTADKLYPLKRCSFFHQMQNGPYCQTVSVNNLLGDNLVNPDTLHKKLNLGNNHIGQEFTTCRTLELFSIIRIEQRKKLLSLLENSDNTLATSSFKKTIEESKYLLQELNCRACDLDSGNQQQVKKFIDAAEKAGINRLHLTFPTSPGVMHAIALRRDPSSPQLWIILDGNLPAYRLSLRDALEGYSQRGSIRLVARKDLFKVDPSIACCQIKQKPEGGVILTEPTPEKLSQWRSVSSQNTERTRFSIPTRLDTDLYHWKQQNQKAYLRSQSLPTTLPSYRIPN